MRRPRFRTGLLPYTEHLVPSHSGRWHLPVLVEDSNSLRQFGRIAGIQLPLSAPHADVVPYGKDGSDVRAFGLHLGPVPP